MIDNKNIVKIIDRIQANDSIMCKCFCIKFVDFMIKIKSFLGDYNKSLVMNVKKTMK